LSFRTIPVSLLSLFRAATMEDWTDIMYISIYGCNVYSSGIYYDLASYDPKYYGQDAVGADNNFFATWEEVPNYFKCNKPAAQPALSAFYWIFFIMVCSWVMLALFVGAITIAMSETMDADEGDDDAEAEEEAHRDKIAPRAEDMATMLKQIWNKYAVATGDRLMPVENEIPQYRWGAYSRFAELNRNFANLEWFQTFVTLTILAAGVTVGVDTELLAPEPMGQNFPTPADDASSLANQLWYWDTVINWIFTVEVTVKLVGEDWHPWTYFDDGWNVFDFIIVFTSWLPVLMDAFGAGGGGGLGALKLLRLLRLFRIMRVVKKLPELTVIVEALLVAMESIGFIALIIFVVFYLFAILGMMLFSKNDPWHYGKLHRALLTLMRVSTFEDWTDVMYINVYGCAKWGYNDDSLSEQCTERNYSVKWWAAFYFIIFIFLGSFTLITLFVGVVTTSMEEAQGKQRKIMEGEKDANDYFTELGVPPGAVKDVMEMFEILDTNTDGEVTLTEFMAACKCVTEIDGNEQEFPAKLLLEDAGFCDDKSGGEVPDKGNPFILLKWMMNYMARCAGSKASFKYEVEEVEDAAVAALAQAELAKKAKVPAKGSRGASKGDLESSF
jgi:voltage-gated sodium channel